MARPQKPPAYRKRRLPQGDRAYLTLRDAGTGRVKDFNLGPYEAPESRQRYTRLVAEWESNGRRLPSSSDTRATEDRGPTVAQILDAFWSATEPHASAKNNSWFSSIIRIVRLHAGDLAIARFGPNALSGQSTSSDYGRRPPGRFDECENVCMVRSRICLE